MSHHLHHSPDYNRAFAIGVGLNSLYILLEVCMGLWVNSLALLADAGHNLSDVLGLLLAWGAHLLTRIKPSERRTYGWRSSSILAALFNALILLLAIGGILWEAIQRLIEPQAVKGLTVIWVAMIGVVINTATALLFFQGRKKDLNIKGAFWHMAADAGVSLGVVLAGVGIYLSGWQTIDPIISILVAIFILIGTWNLLKDSTNLALQGVPSGIDIRKVRTFLSNLSGVTVVHDLHIWAMSTTETALTAHLVKPEIDNDDHLLSQASHELYEQFGIEHVTIQIERDESQCKQAIADAV